MLARLTMLVYGLGRSLSEPGRRIGGSGCGGVTARAEERSEDVIRDGTMVGQRAAMDAVQGHVGRALTLDTRRAGAIGPRRSLMSVVWRVRGELSEVRGRTAGGAGWSGRGAEGERRDGADDGA